MRRTVTAYASPGCAPPKAVRPTRGGSSGEPQVPPLQGPSDYAVGIRESGSRDLRGKLVNGLSPAVSRPRTSWDVAAAMCTGAPVRVDAHACGALRRVELRRTRERHRVAGLSVAGDGVQEGVDGGCCVALRESRPTCDSVNEILLGHYGHPPGRRGPTAAGTVPGQRIRPNHAGSWRPDVHCQEVGRTVESPEAHAGPCERVGSPFLTVDHAHCCADDEPSLMKRQATDSASAPPDVTSSRDTSTPPGVVGSFDPVPRCRIPWFHRAR